ncbi:sulfotransferase family 2 domain-containing protein, partial [Burkholderia cenocepacia]|nr:sulfotransferase family 2 domain-containing protein [Burkholderia cenocepacia]
DDHTKLACAIAAISRYEVVGLYEHMSEFMLNVARLIGIEPLERLSKVNVTSQRPKATEISPTLRERLVELNRLDLEFYNQLSEFRQQRSVQESALPAQPLP